MTLSAYVQYQRPWASHNIQWFTRVEYAYTDSYYLAQDLDENLTNDATNIFNIRLGIQEISYQWEVMLWGRNITDEDYMVVGFDIPTLSGYAGSTAPPATYGLMARYRFGS